METTGPMPEQIQFRQEPGGQNAERQWRPISRNPRRNASAPRAGGDRTPKGNGDVHRTYQRLRVDDLESGGQNAERQWRPDGIVFPPRPRHEPGGQNAERQWRRDFFECRLDAGVGPSRGDRTPKGNGDLEGVSPSQAPLLQSRGDRTPKGNGDLATPTQGYERQAQSRGDRTPKGNGDPLQILPDLREPLPEPGGRTQKGNGDRPGWK